MGYRDYLGALQHYRGEHPLYPDSLDVIERFRACGPTVILSDGDVVFQPRKVERSGIFEVVEGHVLIYVHKEEALVDVERRYPADHYVMPEDKLRILTVLKKAWGSRVTRDSSRRTRKSWPPIPARRT